jgi:biopolymer transport protein ExbB/TolQ
VIEADACDIRYRKKTFAKPSIGTWGRGDVGVIMSVVDAILVMTGTFVLVIVALGIILRAGLGRSIGHLEQIREERKVWEQDSRTRLELTHKRTEESQARADAMQERAKEDRLRNDELRRRSEKNTERWEQIMTRLEAVIAKFEGDRKD